MIRMTRPVAAAALALALNATPGARVAACSCAGGTPEEHARANDAVFVGTVTQIQDTSRFSETFTRVVLYTFDVEGVAKGLAWKTNPVMASDDQSGASCGIGFGPEERWMIFARYDGPTLTTDLCSGNVLLAADEVPPLPVSAPADTPHEAAPFGFPLPLLIAIGTVALVAVVSVVAFMRRPVAARRPSG
jgi:hypothetical protein